MQFDWNNINTVLLDMDGTILDLHFDSHFWLHHMPRVYGQRYQLNEQEVEQRLRPIFDRNAGTLNWYCVDFWSEQLELDVMQIKQEVAHNITYRPKARAFLQLSRDKVNDLRLITNGHRKVLEMKVARTQLDQYFDSMHCSHELGMPKEDPRFWEQLQNTQQFEPDNTLFIDDSEAVLDSARQYGIGHIYSIAKPDSSTDRNEPSKYPMIEAFEN